MVGDLPVRACSQEVTYRDTVTLGAGIGPISSTGNIGDWYVFSLPRQFLQIRQTIGAVPGSLLVEWAIRDSGVVGVPEWLPLLTIPIVAVGTQVNTNLTTGAVWMRFTVTGLAADVYELAHTAFL